MLAYAEIPTGSVNPWMKNLVLFTLAKLPEEQGEYAALAALSILYGATPGIVLPVSLLRTAEIIGREAYEDEPEVVSAGPRPEPAHFDVPAEVRENKGKRPHP